MTTPTPPAGGNDFWSKYDALAFGEQEKAPVAPQERPEPPAPVEPPRDLVPLPDEPLVGPEAEPEKPGLVERGMRFASETVGKRLAPGVAKVAETKEQRAQDPESRALLGQQRMAEGAQSRRLLPEAATGADYPEVAQKKEEIRADVADAPGREPIKTGEYRKQILDKFLTEWHRKFQKANQRNPTAEEIAAANKEFGKRSDEELARLLQGWKGRVAYTPAGPETEEAIQRLPPVVRQTVATMLPPTRLEAGTNVSAADLYPVNVPLSNIWRLGTSTFLAGGMAAEQKARRERLAEMEAEKAKVDSPEERARVEEQIAKTGKRGMLGYPVDMIVSFADAYADMARYDITRDIPILPPVSRAAGAVAKGVSSALRGNEPAEVWGQMKEHFKAPTASGTPEAIGELLTPNMDILNPTVRAELGSSMIGDDAPESLRKAAGIAPALMLLLTEADPLSIGMFGAGIGRQVALKAMVNSRLKAIEQAAENAAKAVSGNEARSLIYKADEGAGFVYDVAVAHRIQREANLAGVTERIEMAGEPATHADTLAKQVAEGRKEAKETEDALEAALAKEEAVAKARGESDENIKILRSRYETWKKASAEARQAEDDLNTLRASFGDANEKEIAQAAEKVEVANKQLDIENRNLTQILAENQNLYDNMDAAQARVAAINQEGAEAVAAHEKVVDDLTAQAGLPKKGEVVTWNVGKQAYTGKVVGYKLRAGAKKQPVYVPIVEDAKGKRKEAVGWWKSREAPNDAQLATMDDLYKKDVAFGKAMSERRFRLSEATKQARAASKEAMPVVAKARVSEARATRLKAEIARNERMAQASEVAKRVIAARQAQAEAMAALHDATVVAKADTAKIAKLMAAHERAANKAGRLARVRFFKETAPRMAREVAEHMRKSVSVARKWINEQIKQGGMLTGSLSGRYAEVVPPKPKAINWLEGSTPPFGPKSGVDGDLLLQNIAKQLEITPEEARRFILAWAIENPQDGRVLSAATTPGFKALSDTDQAKLNMILDDFRNYPRLVQEKQLDIAMAQAIMDTWKDLGLVGKAGFPGTIRSTIAVWSRLIDPVASRVGQWSHNLQELYKSGRDQVAAWNSEMLEVGYLIKKNAAGDKVDNPIVLFNEYLTSAMGMPTRGGVTWFNTFNGETIWHRFRRNILNSGLRRKELDETMAKYDAIWKERARFIRENNKLSADELRVPLAEYDSRLNETGAAIQRLVGETDNVPLMAAARMWLPSGLKTPPHVAARLAGRAASLLADDTITPMKFAEEMRRFTASLMTRAESSPNRAWSMMTSAACLGATHDNIATMTMRISGSNLRPEVAEGLNAALLGNFDSSALAAVSNLDDLFIAARAYGIPLTDATIRVSKEAGGEMARNLVLLQRMGEESVFLPRAILQDIDSAAGRIVKELEPYHKKPIDHNARVVLAGLQNVFNLWRTSVVTGLIVPNPGHWLNTMVGDFSQMWMEEGLLKSSQLSFQNLSTNLPLGRLLHTYMSDMSAKYAGKPVLGTITNALFNPHLGAIFAGRPGSFTTRYGRVMTYDLARQMMLEDNIPSSFVRGLMQDVWARDPLYRNLGSWASNIPNKSGKFLQKLEWEWAGHMDALQARQRAALWLDYMQRGATRQEAKQAVRNALYDWNHAFSKVEGEVASRLTTFWRYFRLALDQSHRGVMEPFVQPSADVAVKAALGQSKFGRARNQGLLVAHSLDTIGDPDKDMNSFEEFVWLVAHQRQSNLAGRPLLANIPSFGEPNTQQRMASWEDIKGLRQGYGYTHEFVSFPIMSVPDVYELYAVPYVAAGVVLPAAIIRALGGPNYLNPGWLEQLWSPVGDLMPEFVRVPVEKLLEYPFSALSPGTELSRVSQSGQTRLSASQLAAINALPDSFRASFGLKQDPETGVWTARTSAILTASNFPGVNQLIRYADSAYFANPEIREGNLWPGTYLALRNLTGIGRVTPVSASAEASRNAMLINKAARASGIQPQTAGYQEVERAPLPTPSEE